MDWSRADPGWAGQPLLVGLGSTWGGGVVSTQRWFQKPEVERGRVGSEHVACCHESLVI